MKLEKLCECGCGQPTLMYAQTNYQRGYTKGTPRKFITGHNFKRPLIDRFWEKVNKHGPIPTHCPELGPCWIWTGAKHPLLYGITWENGSLVRASHVAVYLETKEWPKLHVCHKCDNPSCIRFSHLFEGTRSDNAQDALKKGRLNPWNIGKSKLTKEQKKEIRIMYSQGKISQRELGRKYGVVHATIRRIVQGDAQ